MSFCHQHVASVDAALEHGQGEPVLFTFDSDCVWWRLPFGTLKSGFELERLVFGAKLKEEPSGSAYPASRGYTPASLRRAPTPVTSRHSAAVGPRASARRAATPLRPPSRRSLPREKTPKAERHGTFPWRSRSARASDRKPAARAKSPAHVHEDGAPVAARRRAPRGGGSPAGSGGLAARGFAGWPWGCEEAAPRARVLVVPAMLHASAGQSFRIETRSRATHAIRPPAGRLQRRNSKSP